MTNSNTKKKDNKMIDKNNIKAYACINKNINVRKKSSSGGCFYELAKYITNNKGIVFAARFDDDFNVIHDGFEDEKEIIQYMGSKYVPSKLNNTFNLIKNNLNNGRLVMFCGTPCQNNGLTNFLNKYYDNLIQIDFICHGLPDNRVWEKYLSILKRNGIIKNIQFRNKDSGWKKYKFKVEYENCNPLSEVHNQNIYIRGFLDNLYLKNSCYNCKNKGYSRSSDITLADLWGADNIVHKLDDDQGISAMFINTKKGMDIFNIINNNLICKQIEINDITKYNIAYYESANEHKNRKKFMDKLNNTDDIVELIESCLKEKITDKIVRKLKSVVRKMYK